MYYSGKDKAGRIRIGLALSNDAFHWEKYRNNPVLDVGNAGDWDALYVYGATVWKDQECWRMIFTGCDALNSSHYQIGVAQSPDGVQWSKSRDNPIFCDSNPLNVNIYGKPETEAWGLSGDKNGYYLLYNTVSRKPRQVYVAYSRDLISWKPLSSTPLLPSEGLPSQLGYMKYCGYSCRHGQHYFVAAAVSDKEYKKSAIGLWRMTSLVPGKEKEFLGYILEAGDGWCRRELDTPFFIRNPNDVRVCLYFGGRSNTNNWTEGVALGNLEVIE